MTDAITIVVPVWNRRDLLERLLEGLRAQTRAIAETIVVDDASRDGSAECAERMGARVIRMDERSGFARAVNQGIRASRTPLVAIVNNDVELAPDWLEKLAAAMEPEVWFATGRILQAAAPERIDGTWDELCRGGTSWRVGHARSDGPLFREARVIRSAAFTAALFRAELFERAGLLDERFESYLEDVELGVRCVLAGCAGQYVPEAVARHQGSATLGAWHPESVRRIARNQVFLVAKHYSREMLLRYAWPILLAQGLWGGVCLRHGRGRAWLRGKLEGLRRWSEFRDPLPGAEGIASRAEMLRAGEREIRRIQRNSSTDLYWTLYFLLTAGGAK